MNPRSRIVASLLLLALAPGAFAGQPQDGLQQLRDGQWLSYEVPLVAGAGSPCCFSMRGSKVHNSECSLDEDSWGFEGKDDKPGQPTVLAPEPSLRVFLRRGAGGVDRLRAYGSDCSVDAGNASVTDLGRIEGRASLEFIDRSFAAFAKRQHGHALATMALHAEPSATAVLERHARDASSEETRRDASFWLTQARGEEGFRIVRTLLEGERDDDVRRHLVFAISQSEAPGARPELRRLARSHAEVEIRSEALFWLAQQGDAETEALVQAVLADDASRKVRQKAIFALSQLPKKRAVPSLEALVRSNRPREVRREALFWLGQVGGDEAFKVFDELLGAER